jgi:hypothetical protein
MAILVADTGCKANGVPFLPEAQGDIPEVVIAPRGRKDETVQ